VRLLLDTQVFLWFVAGSPRLKKHPREQIAGAQQVFVSAASIWEATIKAGLGKLEVHAPALVEAIEASGFAELPVRAHHAAAVAKLPLHHRDPFDRLLVAQAIEEPLQLLTADVVLSRYTKLVTVV
jgi:PIN domain nuclease of toxin-antitoxin system